MTIQLKLDTKATITTDNATVIQCREAMMSMTMATQIGVERSPDTIMLMRSLRNLNTAMKSGSLAVTSGRRSSEVNNSASMLKRPAAYTNVQS